MTLLTSLAITGLVLLACWALWDWVRAERREDFEGGPDGN